jgi:hypothetical protein
MCGAASDFNGIAAVHYLATDPSDLGQAEWYVSSGRSDEVWTVVANALFLHNVVWISGPDNPMLEMNQHHEPEVVSLALHLVERRVLIEPVATGAGIEEALAATWEPIERLPITANPHSPTWIVGEGSEPLYPGGEQHDVSCDPAVNDGDATDPGRLSG